jgi:hypothetical protein
MEVTSECFSPILFFIFELFMEGSKKRLELQRFEVYVIKIDS